MGVRYCIQQFIPEASAWFFDGDNRAFSGTGGSYRASQWFGHGVDGNLWSRVDAGVSVFQPLDFLRKGVQGPNSATEICEGNCKTYRVRNNTSNGVFFGAAPYSTHDVTIRECNGKVVSITGDHSPYPNLEVWQYGDGAPRLLYGYDKGSRGPLDLTGGKVNIPVPGGP